MINITAYKPLARFGRVYYLPTQKGFIFYDKRSKTALYSAAFARKIYNRYSVLIEPRGEWELPTTTITVKNWACGILDKSIIDEQYEKKIFILMGYHYVQLGKPKNFWEGLINIDGRFKEYVLPSFKIDQKGSMFFEKPPFKLDKTLKILERMQNKYLTKKLIYDAEKILSGDEL